MSRHDAPRPVRHRLTTVTTDGRGHFRSGPVKLNREAVWVLLARPAAGSGRDTTPSCGPVVTTTAPSRPAYQTDLDGKKFRSVPVRGTKLVRPRAVSVSFRIRLVDHDGVPATVMRRVRTLVGSAGCNRMSGLYWLKDSRLRWSKRLASTKIRCRKPVDQWLARTLQRGVKARMVKRRLVLKGKNGVKIVLRQTGRS